MPLVIPGLLFIPGLLSRLFNAVNMETKALNMKNSLVVILQLLQNILRSLIALGGAAIMEKAISSFRITMFAYLLLGSTEHGNAIHSLHSYCKYYFL